jgi:MFS family permease
MPEQAVIAAPGSAVQRRQHSWSVLRHRNYALLFWGQLISSTGTQMQIVAVAWQVFLLTHSAIALGLIGLFQAIPRIIFSLVGGMFADVFDRRKLLLVIQIVTPDEFRGRISSVNAMFAFGGPLLGQLEAGLVASFTSPQFSVISGGMACILATLAIVALVPNLLRVQVK